MLSSVMKKITVRCPSFLTLARRDSLFEQRVSNAAVLACKRNLAFATDDFGSQCRDASFEFRDGKGVNILFDKIGQRVVAAERQIIIDIHAAYFTQQQLLSI